jgi:hypothetical protein
MLTAGDGSLQVLDSLVHRPLPSDRDAPAGSLTFVLPVALAETGRPGSDLGRLTLLLETFARYFDSRDLASFLVITRPLDIARVRQHLADVGADFAEVRDETEVCPSLASDPPTLHSFPVLNKGWFRQQLLKLAIAREIATDFYMTLDSDVVFTRPFSAHDLIRAGHSLVNTQSREDFQLLFVDDVAEESERIRRERDERAAQLLGLTRTHRCFYGETPVVLSTTIVRALLSHLDQRNGQWDEWLIENIPWTEYSLYFTFAEGTDAFDRHHIRGDVDAVMRMTDSLWYGADAYRVPRDIETWTWTAEQRRDGVAVVVQSYLGYDMTAVRRKLVELSERG